MSYDLGVSGDYEGLYRWLDDHEAQECSSSMAMIRFECKESLKAELERALDHIANVPCWGA
jgi:hypothetical protein